MKRPTSRMVVGRWRGRAVLVRCVSGYCAESGLVFVRYYVGPDLVKEVTL